MNINRACAYLKKADLGFSPIVEKSGTISLPPPRENFEALVDSIVSQQLSVKAAATIFQRVCLVLENEITPANVFTTPTEQLRGAGLSGQKSKYLFALAEAFAAEPKIYRQLDQLSDEEVIETLTAIKGIGVWTAQMFLMFTLLREDVFPVGDLGIRRGMERFFFDGEKQSHETLIERAKIWSPYRSVACLYLWKAQD